MTKSSIQIVKVLQQLGMDARQVQTGGSVQRSGADIAHVFNSWHPHESFTTVKKLFGNGLPIVFSPRYLHLGELKYFAPRVLRAFRQAASPDIDLEQQLIHIAHASRQLRSKGDFDALEYLPGYFDQVRQMVEMADEVICQSKYEKSLLWGIGARVSQASIVPLGIDTQPYADADAAIFSQHLGVKEYVLCVGNLEWRNNQLLLAHALRDTHIPLVFIGAVGDQDYSELVRAHAGRLAHFLEYPEPGTGLLASALAGCRLFVSPSFCDSAPATALQAGAAGAPLLLSDRSAEREYFGNLANYCDPADVRSLKETVLSLYEAPQPSARRRDVREFVRSQFHINKFAAEAVKVYQRALSKRKTRRTLFGIPENALVCIDVTCLVQASEPLTDESRAELVLIRELVKRYPDRVRICAWDSEYKFITKQAFLAGECSAQAAAATPPRKQELSHLETQASRAALTRADQQCRLAAALPPESILLILGDAWLRCERYARNVHYEIQRNRLRLAAIVNDALSIDVAQFDTDKNLAAFRFGFSNLLRDANLLIAYSNDQAERLRASFLSRGFAPPPIKTLQVGCSAAEIWNHFQQYLLNRSLALDEGPRAAVPLPEDNADASCPTGEMSVILIGRDEHDAIPLLDDAAVACDSAAVAKIGADFVNQIVAPAAPATFNGRERVLNKNAVPLVDVDKVKQDILREYRRRKSTPRVLIECTHTMSTDVISGIQRVVRNVIRESTDVQGDLGIECVPVVIDQGEFHKVGEWKTQNDVQVLAKVGERIRFSDRDILLMLDASWHLPAWSAVRRARRSGCRFACFYHDLIPVCYPEFCDDVLTMRFREWLHQAMQHADFFVANSKHTGRVLEEYIRSSGLAPHMRAEQFTSIRLGADFSNIATTAPPRPELSEIFAAKRSKSPYLCVGTIEPRKNHRYVLDAFELLWRQGAKAKLCIAGRVGWKIEDFVSRVRRHPQFGKSLFMFNDLNDAELQYCYERGKAMIFPSIVEGFGIPIVEALHFGLPTFASDTPIHREVGEDFCSYFDLDNPQALASLIRNIERNGQYPSVKSATGYRFTSWHESCRELLTKCLELSKLAPHAAQTPVDAVT